MKAKVTKGFTDEYKRYSVGTVLEIKDDAVYDEVVWICDVDCPFFKRHFELIKD